MSRRCSLETQTKKVNMIIDLPFNNSIDFVVDELKKLGFVYGLILHDKDVNKDGELKTPHYHLVLNSPKRHRLKYYLSNISDIFDKVDIKGNPTTDGVEVSTSESLEWDIQYLIHKNDLDKHQYDRSMIITNIPVDNLDEMLSIEVHKDITINDVLDVVCTSETRTEIAIKLGVGHFNLYHNVIETAIREGYLGSNLVRDVNFGVKNEN